MKRFAWHITAAIILISVSAIGYALQIELFHKSQDTFFYLLQDIAFIPIQVLLVTVVLNEVMKGRQKYQMRHKMNMVIGAFFSEAGNELLSKLISFDTRLEEIAPILIFDQSYTQNHQARAIQAVQHRADHINSQSGDLSELKSFLISNRSFLMGLLENENLLEHESFTDLMWATTHLTEELSCRTQTQGLPASDYAHLSVDIDRVYRRLISAWLAYSRHLKEEYPYMFSLVLRSNPFDQNASIHVD